MALISRGLILNFGYNNSEVEKKVNPQYTIQHEAIGSAKPFHPPCEERFRQRRFHNFIRKFFIVVHLAVQNALVFIDGSLEVIENVRLARIEAIWVVNVLIIDVDFNIGKN